MLQMEAKQLLIDVIGFLCVSLGSSTVQLHNSLGAHAYIQRLVKMATVSVYTTEERNSVVHFLCAKRFKAKDIYKEMFLVYCGKCPSRETVHKWVENFSQGRSKVAVMPDQVREVAETTVRYFCAAGFDAPVKQWDRCVRVGGGYVEKSCFSSGSNITCFTFRIHL
jgi:hypothetical protein